jgi:myo-inositol-1(or 4)-monophosphatase
MAFPLAAAPAPAPPAAPALDAAPELDAMLRTAVAAAEAAGRYLRERAGGRIDFRGKGASGDVVSELDLGAERLIVRRLREAYPEIPVLAEESGLAQAAEAAETPWLWLVDPLDGTNNLAIGLPAYVVGVALCRDGEPVASVVHEPESGRSWRARLGSGVIGPGGLPLSRTGRPRGADAAGSSGGPKPVVAWTQGYRVAREDPGVGALKAVLEREARRTLPLWAPLLGWTMLARGDIDAFVGYRPELIDLPGGLLLAREAGMEVRTLTGRPFAARLDQYAGPDTDLGFVCAAPELMPRLLGWAQRARDLEPAWSRVFDEGCVAEG